MAMGRIADHVGRVLGGRYRLIAPIGTGGSAHVYLAEDSTLRRRVAVKVLHAALAEDESFLRRFRAEAQAAAALNHPNVMRVFDWGEDEDGPYLVLEHLGGGSLRDVLDSGQRLSVEQAAAVGQQAARALDYAHRRGLVHRDIKPANLLFDDEGRLCIADFGVARALAEASWTEPSGALVGTARYAAPEQAQAAAIDGKADVYALGLVLIEAVTGQVPFAGETPLATLLARVDRPVDVPAALGPLQPVLGLMGRADPAERPDAAAVARDLDAAARALPDPAPIDLVGPRQAPADQDLTELPGRPRVYDREADLADPTGIAPLAAAPAGRGRRRGWLVALLIVVGLIASAGAAYAIVKAATPSHPVPVLTGQNVAQARAAAHRLHFRVAVSRVADENAPEGTVLRQFPRPGTSLKERSSVRLVVSKGPPPRPVPQLTGLTSEQARSALQAAGFVADIAEQSDETVPKDRVMSWSPQGTQPKGTTITVVVSSGPPTVAIPDLTHDDYNDAANQLKALGVTVVRKDDYSDDEPNPGKVISTLPAAGSSVPKGSKVTVVVSKGPKTVTVPTVTGTTLDRAKATVVAAGLTVGNVYGPDKGRFVVLQTPSAGDNVPRGSSVDLYVAGH